MVYEYLGDTNKPLILLAHAHHAETSMLCQTMKFASNRFHNLAADPSETFKQGKITLIDTQVLFASLNLKARLNLKACCERMELPVRTGYHNAGPSEECFVLFRAEVPFFGQRMTRTSR